MAKDPRNTTKRELREMGIELHLPADWTQTHRSKTHKNDERFYRRSSKHARRELRERIKEC
jgi:hypothetical protein